MRSIGFTLLLAASLLNSIAANAATQTEVRCEFLFGKGDDPLTTPKFSVAEDGSPRIRLNAQPARCDSALSSELNSLIEEAQKACMNGVLLSIRSQVGKTPAPSNAQAPACDCPECGHSFEAISKLVKDSARFIDVLNQGQYVSLSSLNVERELESVIARMERLASEADSSKAPESCKKSLEVYTRAALSELKFQNQHLKDIRDKLKRSRRYWDQVDGMGGEAAMSSEAALAYAKSLAQSSDPLRRRIGELIAEARRPNSPDAKATAQKLQMAISSFHAEEILSGTFIVDGIVAKRTISDIRRLLDKRPGEFARRLQREGVMFAEGVIPKSESVVPKSAAEESARNTRARILEAQELGERAPSGAPGRILLDPKNPEGPTVPVTGAYVGTTRPEDEGQAKPIQTQQQLTQGIRAHQDAKDKYDIPGARKNPNTGFVRMEGKKVLCNVQVSSSGAVLPKLYAPNILKDRFGGRCPQEDF